MYHSSAIDPGPCKRTLDRESMRTTERMTNTLPEVRINSIGTIVEAWFVSSPELIATALRDFTRSCELRSGVADGMGIIPFER